MASNCSKLMKEALDSFLGIEYRYKMNDLLDSLPNNQKFTSEQLKGYMLKQGVSPKEIEASNIFKGFENDNRALTIEEWKGINPSSQALYKREMQGYEDITLGKQGIDNPTYKVNEFMTATRADMNTNLRHQFDTEARGSQYSKQSQLGWNRVHQDTINGKPTTILNELQSDWMQAERQGAGTFESNIDPAKIKSLEQNINFLEKKASNLHDELFNIESNITKYETIKNKVSDKLANDPTNQELLKEWNDLKYTVKELKAYRNTREYEDLAAELAQSKRELEANKARLRDYSKNTIKDFPMKPEKFQQLMIVDGVNEAISNGTMRVAIPIERTGSDLVGTEGVTKFYESLNKKILPDIRSKLEKQGLRIKVSQEDYFINIDKLHNLHNKNNYNALYYELETYYRNNSSWDIVLKAILQKDDTNITRAIDRLLDNPNNKLHILEIEEVPNAKVKWDVYGLLASIGLGAYASKGEANTQISKDSLAPRELAIETKQTQKAIADDKLDLATLMPERPYEINPKDYKDTNKGIKSYIASIESRGVTDPYKAKNKSTGAEGKYQILPSNYEELARKTKIPMSELTRPSNQEKVMDYLVGEYKDRLETWNIPVNKENIFVLHNLGMTGGLRVLRGTYQASDIVKMSKQLPSNMDKSNQNAIINNYATMYNVVIPNRRRA